MNTKDFKTLSASLITLTLALGYSSEAYAENHNSAKRSVKHKTKAVEKKRWEDSYEVSYDDQRTTSLLEATVYTGLPALGLTVGWFAYKMRDQEVSGKILWNNFKGAFQSPPTWDHNPWYVNYVGHPIFGSEAYLLARNRDCSIMASFLYSTAASVTWEYGIESWSGGHPSIQDLVVTSPFGSVIGELRYFGKNQLLKKKNRSTFEDVIIVTLDPIDALYRALE